MIELKNLEVSLGLSQASLAFSCTAYWCGRKLAVVDCTGRGDEPHVRVVGSQADFKAATTYAEAQPMTEDGKPAVCQATGKVIYHDLGTWIEHLAAETKHRQQLSQRVRRWLKKTIAIVDGKVLRFDAVYTPQVRDAILRRHPGAEVLNAMPFGQVLDRIVAVSYQGQEA